MPDATIHYWLPKAESTLTVVESYACTPDKTDFVVVATPSIRTSYSADTVTGTRQQVKLKDLDRWYASSTATFGLTEDGRLKSFNATTTGTGGEIVKAVVGVVTGVRAGDFTKARPFVLPPSTPLPLCEVIERLGDPKTKTITITRSASIDHMNHFALDASGKHQAVKFEEDAATRFLYLAIQALTVTGANLPPPVELFTRLDLPFGSAASKQGPPEEPRIDWKRGVGTQAKSGATANPDAGPVLILNRVRRDTLRLVSTKGADAPIILSTFRPAVPDRSTYAIPIPKPVFFGESNAVVALADSGELTSITYGAKSEKGPALDTLSQLNSMANPSVIQLAAEEMARADLIAHQQRVANCLANPANCKP